MISVIIPACNEEEHIGRAIRHLRKAEPPGLVKEIIVADGGSTDRTVAKARQEGVSVLSCMGKGRALQMNQGALLATCPVLYFLNADTFPPLTFVKDIQDAVSKGFGSGCYRQEFDYNHWFLKASSWFTRFNMDVFRFADRSLFVTREVFDKAGGFEEKLMVLEDQELIRRLRQHAPFKVMDNVVTTSARKYRENGVYWTQGVLLLTSVLNRLGVPQENIQGFSRKLIKQ